MDWVGRSYMAAFFVHEQRPRKEGSGPKFTPNELDKSDHGRGGQPTGQARQDGASG